MSFWIGAPGDVRAWYVLSRSDPGVAPWWPAGHCNRGLILGELKDYEEAIDELKRYLKVEPDSANARAVQLKIYEWEGLVSKAGK